MGFLAQTGLITSVSKDLMLNFSQCPVFQVTVHSVQRGRGAGLTGFLRNVQLGMMVFIREGQINGIKYTSKCT